MLKWIEKEIAAEKEKTLIATKSLFDIQSDFSTQCNGYKALSKIINNK